MISGGNSLGRFLLEGMFPSFSLDFSMRFQWPSEVGGTGLASRSVCTGQLPGGLVAMG